MTYGWPVFCSPREINDRKEPKGGFTAGPSLCCPTRVTKGKNSNGDLRLDTFFSSHEGNTREEPEVTYDWAVVFFRTRATKQKNLKGDLRLERHSVQTREQQKRRARRVTYGWAVFFLPHETHERKEPEGESLFTPTSGSKREEPEGRRTVGLL